MIAREAAWVAAPLLTAVFAGLLWRLTVVMRRPGFPGDPVILLGSAFLAGVYAAVAWWLVAWAAGIGSGAVFLAVMVAWARRMAKEGEG